MATKQIAWNTGNGNITLTYQGQGDGTISVQSDANDGGARSQVITVETVDGAITRNLTISQAACPFPVGDIKNFSYTGSYQEVALPAGKYKLQCWGAQGGSNAAASSYSITAKAGGKGGYSEGIITLSQSTTMKVYVGGQGSSSAGGFNGGGSTSGSSSYSQGTSGLAGYHYGTSRMGGGGGATDIRLSDGALLSRMIVAGGGSGGAMCYQNVTTSVTTNTFLRRSLSHYTTWSGTYNGVPVIDYFYQDILNPNDYNNGDTCTLSIPSGQYSLSSVVMVIIEKAGGGFITSNSLTFTVPSNRANNTVRIRTTDTTLYSSTYLDLYKVVTTSSTSTSNDSQTGYVGGGANGGGYSSSYYGKQNGAGSSGSFGQGANQTTTNYRYCSGAGGGGWYGGGGGQQSDSSMTYCKYSGGGSGFVNTASSASNRPSGYTGLQLDSGTTKDGATSFEAPGGGNETGHAGNGYARITRLS